MMLNWQIHKPAYVMQMRSLTNPTLFPFLKNPRATKRVRHRRRAESFLKLRYKYPFHTYMCILESLN